MKKVYIDVTQLYEWQGKVTGIQRVMYEVSRRFADDKRFDPIFIIWDGSVSLFYQIDFDKIIQDREKAQHITGSGSLKSENKKALSADAAKRFSKKAYHVLPLSRTGRKLYLASKSKFISQIARGNTINIESDSILFMPHGGVWGSQTYVREIMNLRASKGVKLVTILYDLCPVLSPQFVVEPVRIAYEKYMKKVLPKSHLILSISKNTAEDARQWLQAEGESKANIEVFRLGDEVSIQSPKPVDISQPYILCVGTIEARKNHTGLYYAYKLAAAEGKQLPLVVVVGRKGWMAGDVYQLITTDPDTKNKFKFFHDISDDELAWLYENALFSVYPSFYEGWGLPIAESLLRGTPCLASETSSMKEIGGELVEYFSPYSPNQIKDRIEKFSTQPKLLKDKRTQIAKNYKATTWDTTYSQVAGFLNKA